MELAQYLDLFVSEAQDHLQEMNQSLLALEENPADLSRLEAFFRAAHTLKSMSATMGFQRMATLSHDMEDVLAALRRGEYPLDSDMANVLFCALDRLTELLQGIVSGAGEQGDIDSVQEKLRSCAERPASTPLPTQGALPEAGWVVEVTIAPDCRMKGPRAFLVLRKLSAVATMLGSDPPQDALHAGQYERGFRVFVDPEADPQALQRAGTSVSEVVAVTVHEIAPAAPAAALAAAATAPPAAESPAATAPTLAAAAPIVRIKVALLDQLLEAVAELIISRSHLAQIARKHALTDLDEVIEAHVQAMGLLQETVLAMRMTPVGQVFNRFPRMVRDLADHQGKQVRLEMEGLEIELDRTILDKIVDPLVHLLRNAVDHGIEPPEERRETGKPLPARISLRARRERDRAIIQLSDDGRGISSQKIAQVAVERGLVTQHQVAELAESAILELICRPGFSTRSAVTGVSGRGVGMEVVKTALDDIGGTLEIQSQLGEGTSFLLALPLTMAIIPALLVRVQQEVYALPLTHIVRTIEPDPDEVRWLQQQPLLRWEERMLPLVHMADLLEGDFGRGRLNPEEKELTIVVVERGQQRYGLVIDEILGKEDIVLKPLDRILQQIEGLTGVTIRGEGEVVLVLDIPGLVQMHADRHAYQQNGGGPTER